MQRVLHSLMPSKEKGAAYKREMAMQQFKVPLLNISEPAVPVRFSLIIIFTEGSVIKPSVDTQDQVTTK